MVTDPRSGEIITSHVAIFHSVQDLLQRWYFVMCATIDKNAREYPLSKEIMGRLAATVLTHEVGHTLGLMHNYMGSTIYPVDSLRNKEFIRKNGLGASIMDYQRFNYVAQPEDGLEPQDLYPRIGIYDNFAIEWGYRYYSDSLDVAAETMMLRRWVKEKRKNPALLYVKETDFLDPRVQSEDFGSDIIYANSLGIKNLKIIMDHLQEWTPSDDMNYFSLRRRYLSVLSQYSNYINHALKIMGEEKAERARLLYVAMTRARERLILIGTASGKDPVRKWALAPGSYRVWQAGSMLDWVAQAAYSLPEAEALRAWNGNLSTGKQESDAESGKKYTTSTGYPQNGMPWELCVWYESGGSGVDKKENIHILTERLLQQDARSIPPEMALRLSVKGTGETIRLPLKTSVTSLCKQRLLPGFLPAEGEETQEIKAKPEELALPLRLSPLPARPGFLERKAVSPVDLGTATHKALGCLSLAVLKGCQGEALRLALEEEVEMLTQQGLLTPAQRNGLYTDWLRHFFESDWGQRLLQSPFVRREWAFNFCLNREPLMLVQGVIDCCFMEDGAWVLIDYKTDFVKDEQAVLARYAPQLQLYRRALEEITGIPVKEDVIFLLRTAQGLRPRDPRQRDTSLWNPNFNEKGMLS